MNRATLTAAVAQGLSTRDLAKRFSTSQTNVRHHLRKHGLATAPIRKPRTRRKRVKAKCLFCKTNDAYKKFCSNRCQYDYDLKQWIDAWLKNEIAPLVGSSKIRRALIYLVGNKCERCGWCEVHPVTEKIPVQVHHKDGDDSNNRRDNVDLLCPNCHSLTPNYGKLNVRRTPKPYIRNPKSSM